LTRELVDAYKPAADAVHAIGVFDEAVTTADLLEAWREATRAAELAERLASVALDVSEEAERNAVASEEIAEIAERAADAAQQGAETARSAALRARQSAAASRDTRLRKADEDVVNAREAAARAGDMYHRAEEDARSRQRPEG